MQTYQQRLEICLNERELGAQSILLNLDTFELTVEPEKLEYTSWAKFPKREWKLVDISNHILFLYKQIECSKEPPFQFTPYTPEQLEASRFNKRMMDLENRIHHKKTGEWLYGLCLRRDEEG